MNEIVTVDAFHIKVVCQFSCITSERTCCDDCHTLHIFPLLTQCSVLLYSVACDFITRRISLALYCSFQTSLWRLTNNVKTSVTPLVHHFCVPMLPLLPNVSNELLEVSRRQLTEY